MDGGRGGAQGFPAHPGMTLLGSGGVLAKQPLRPAEGLRRRFLVKIHDRPLQECGQEEAVSGVHSRHILDGGMTIEDDLVEREERWLALPRRGVGFGGEGGEKL